MLEGTYTEVWGSQAQWRRKLRLGTFAELKSLPVRNDSCSNPSDRCWRKHETSQPYLTWKIATRLVEASEN